MVRNFKIVATATLLSLLCGCVTQTFENSNTPVVENETTNNEIAMTRISLGLGYLKMGNTEQAKFNLEKAKKFSPNLVEVHAAFAHYYESVGEDAKTIQSYEKALSIKPNDADTLNNYGVFLCRKERYADAEKQFLHAIEVPSYIRVAQSYENLALCQLQAPDFDKAETYLGKAIDHSPSNASTLYQMMRLQYAMGNYQDAMAFGKRFEKSTRRFNPEALALSYKIYKKLGNNKIAANYGTMLVKMFPESWYAKQYLLNELASIDADQLAEKYQLIARADEQSSQNKRVVVLSPNQKPAIKLTPKNNRNSRDIVSPKPEQGVNTKAKRVVVLKAPEAKKTVSAQNDQIELVEPQEQQAESQQAQTELADVVTQTGTSDQNDQSEQESSDTTDALVATLATEQAVELEGEITEQSENPSKSENSVRSELPTEVTAPEVTEPAPDFTERLVEQNNLKQNSTEENEELTSTDEPVNTQEQDSEQQLEQVSAAPVELIATEPELDVPTLAELPQHKVVKGDNLFAISKRYNIHIRSLKKWNKLNDKLLVKIGEIVYLTDPSVASDYIE